MKRLVWLLLAGLLQAQPSGFEVASVKMYSNADAAPANQGLVVAPDGIRATHVTLRGCLQWAYGVADVSGPAWISEESYDIAAKASGPVAPGNLRTMMQALLAERFKLVVHPETKESSVGVLVIGKNGVRNLSPVETGARFQMKRASGKLELENASMQVVANVLGSPLGNMPIETVMDQTGLKGFFDITLDLASFDPKDASFEGNYREMRDALFRFVSAALEKNYGLKLEHRNLPMKRLVVDSGTRVPSAN